MTRQKTDHHTTTRTHQPRGSTRRFAQRTRRTNLHRTQGRLDASSCQPRGSATSCPLLLSTGHHRSHLGSLRSAERHPQGSLDLGAHAGPLDLAYAAARAQRVLDNANQMILRREARRRRFDEDIEQAKTAAREASLVVEMAQQALAQSVASAAAGVTAAPLPSTRSQGVAPQRPRPGDATFFEGSVARMASAPRVEFSPALATAVVETASAFLTSGRPGSWQVDALSVEVIWTRTPHTGQTRAAPTLALVKALLMAHDEDPDPVFWLNPRGRVGGTQPGGTATQRQSRPRGPQPWRWQQKWWGWRPPPLPRG